MHLAAVSGFEVEVATVRVAAGRRDRRRARALGGPQAVDAVVVGLPALAAGLPLRVLVHDLEEAIGARHREVRRAVARIVLDDALPDLNEDAGVDVERAEVDLGVFEIGVVGELRHHAVGVAEGEAHAVGGALDVLGDQDVGAGLADPGEARQVELRTARPAESPRPPRRRRHR